MLNLLAKDFKLLFGKEKGIARRIATILVTLIFIACFIAIEVFLFTTILNKISKYDQAPIAYMNLFLTVISILIIIANIFQAKRLFFNEKDIEQLANRPVSNGQIISSKMVFLLIMHYGTSLLFVYPLFVAYGIIFSRSFIFYYLALFYPLFSFLFEMGIALILVYPVWLINKYLRKHLIIRFICALVIIFICCYLYSKVLNLFIAIVADNNINVLFTTDSINFFMNLRKYEFPTNFLVDIFISYRTSRIWMYLLIAIGVFAIGCTICIAAYGYVRNISIKNKAKKIKKEPKLVSPKKALLKKEFLLITKNPGYILSFTGLLIVQPFLVFLVTKSMNTIFSKGIFKYYVSVVPNFLPLMDVLILMLFTVIIAQGASSYISMEKKTIKVIKILPVEPQTQLMIKVLIPLVMSVASLFVTTLVLLVGKLINFPTFIFGFLLTLALLLIFSMICLREELHIRHLKPRSTFRSNLCAYLLPIAYFVITALLSYLKINLILAYFIGLILISIIGVIIAIILKKNAKSWFMDLDVVN